MGINIGAHTTLPEVMHERLEFQGKRPDWHHDRKDFLNHGLTTEKSSVKSQNCISIAWQVMNHIIIPHLFITSQLALTNTTLADNLHRAVKSRWIFLGAPLIFNEAPRNSQGNLTGLPPHLLPNLITCKQLDSIYQHSTIGIMRSSLVRGLASGWSS